MKLVNAQCSDCVLDNIAPPVAACLGDLVTLCLLGLVSTALIRFVNTVLPLILLILIVLEGIACGYLVYHNRHVRDLVKQGWVPLFGAMLISSSTGIILDHFVKQYNGYAVLAIVIGGATRKVSINTRLTMYTGLPGGIGAVFVSRLSTALHAAHDSLTLHPPENKNAHQPSTRLISLTLLLITLPIEITFLITLRAIGWLQVPAVFIFFSIFFFCTAVSSVPATFPTTWLTKPRSPCRDDVFLGISISTDCKSIDPVFVGQRLQSRHVRPTHPFFPHGPHRTIAARRLLRARRPFGSKSSNNDLIIFLWILK